MRLFKTTFALWLVVTAGVAFAGPEDVIRSKLQQAVPGTDIKSIKPAALPGFYEVSIPGALVYVSADGQFVLQGELLQLKGKQVVNLTEQAQASARVGLIRAIDKRQAVVFPANGKPKAVITVFTDTHCGYCRKLHQEVPAMNKVGIEVRYLAYPRDLPRVGVNAGTGAELANIWCASNPEQAMTLAKQGQAIPAARKGCKAPIAEQYALGQQMGVTGTPAIFDEKGRQLGGYLTAKQAAQRLGLN
jgi:thiol:disulfide interchange protein DsbC